MNSTEETTDHENPELTEDSANATPQTSEKSGGCSLIAMCAFILWGCSRSAGHFYYTSKLPTTYRYVRPNEGAGLVIYWGMWFLEVSVYVVITWSFVGIYRLGRRSLSDRFNLAIPSFVCVWAVAAPFLPPTRNVLLACDCLRILYGMVLIYLLIGLRRAKETPNGA